MEKEPAVIIGLVTALIQAVIVAVVKLGILAWTPEQQTAVAAALVAAATLIGALVTRGNVWAPDTVRRLAEPNDGEDG